MQESIKGATKSKTMWLAVLLAFLQPVLENLPELKTLLADNYGLAFVGLSAVIAALRAVTNKSLSEKNV